MGKKLLKEKYFIRNDLTDLFWSAQKSAFTCPTCFEDDVYSANSEADAQSVVSSNHLTDCAVIMIQRFVSAS